MKNLVTIENKIWKLEVDLNGGRVKKLERCGELVLGTFNRIDGKTGNTHVCVPNFADEGMENGLPFHGPFRNMEWEVEMKNEKRLIIFAEEMDLKVRQIFELGEKFRQEITVKNTGKTQLPVNIGLHNYWAVKGNWLGTKINGKDVVDEIIESKFIEAKEKNLIEFGDGRKINLELDCFNCLKLWTGFEEQDDQKIFDVDYVCIEPVRGKSGEYYGKKESILEAGKEIGVKQTIY